MQNKLHIKRRDILATQAYIQHNRLARHKVFHRRRWSDF